MTVERIAVTGGNGRIGGAIIEELNLHGYWTVNLNRGKRQQRVVQDDGGGADAYVQTQMLNPGNVYSALAKSNVDAIVHMASIPNPTTNVGYETFRSNVMSTYHVLEAAAELEIETVVVPSSVNVMGALFQEAHMELEYLPVDEQHPVTPRDPYATSKHNIEVTADAFGRRPGAPRRIASLRYPWVATTSELQETFVEGDRSLAAMDEESTNFTRDTLFTYLHIDDAASVARAAIEADFEGHERFWPVADDTTSSAPTMELARNYYPEADCRHDFQGRQALVSTEKARRLLEWRPSYTWA